MLKSGDDNIGNQQKNAFLFKNGDTVTAGQVIGKLFRGGDGAHIDFGITEPGTRVCPEPSFTESAKNILVKLHSPLWIFGIKIEMYYSIHFGNLVVKVNIYILLNHLCINIIISKTQVKR